MSLLDRIMVAVDRGSDQLDKWVDRHFNPAGEETEPQGWAVDSHGETERAKPPPPVDSSKRRRTGMSVDVFERLPVDSAATLIWKLALKHPQGPEVIRRIGAIHEDEVDRLIAALMADLDVEGVTR